MKTVPYLFAIAAFVAVIFCVETGKPMQLTGFFVAVVFAAVAACEFKEENNPQASKIVRAFLFGGLVDYTKMKK